MGLTFAKKRRGTYTHHLKTRQKYRNIYPAGTAANSWVLQLILSSTDLRRKGGHQESQVYIEIAINLLSLSNH